MSGRVEHVATITLTLFDIDGRYVVDLQPDDGERIAGASRSANSPDVAAVLAVSAYPWSRHLPARGPGEVES